MLVTFSGIDGAGKTTQINLLKEYLSSSKVKYKYLWSRGGYTPGINSLKKMLRILLGRKAIPMGRSNERNKKMANPFIAYVWLNLAILDLIFYYGVYIRFLNFNGFVILCDRYIGDTYIDFRLNFKGVPFEKFALWKLLKVVAPKADSSFLFLVPTEVSLKRSIEKDEPYPDSEEVLRDRLNLYSNTCASVSCEYLVIDGRDDKALIQSKIRNALNGIL